MVGPLEFRVARKDGSPCCVEISGIYLDAGFLTAFVDVTARKQAEDSLRISEARYRLLAENALDVIWTMDFEGRFTYVSPSIVRLRGFSVAEVMAQSWEEIFTPDSLTQAMAHFSDFQARAVAGKTLKPLRIELEQRCKGGGTVWTDVLASPFIDDQGNFKEILGITRNITEQKEYERGLHQAREAAEAASKAKSEFLAHMSHEIRTPLNAILGLAQLLAREPLQARQQAMVRGIGEAGESLLFILNDILDLSKIEAGKLALDPHPEDLGRLMARLESQLSPLALAKGLALRVEDQAGQLGPLLVDAQRLEQVLGNLFSNAVKFTAQGLIRLRIETKMLSRDRARLRFEVSDTGIGMSPQTLAGLFVPFNQGDTRITRRYGGTGLGLAISKRLVDLMGGEMGAESELGQGSLFWFELSVPRVAGSLVEDPGPGVSQEVATAGGPGLAQVRVLVVDDSEINRQVVAQALEREGALVTLAVDGAQAVSLLRRQPPPFDAVLMDVQMPDMDGLTATRIIREELGLHTLPIIALTAGVLLEQQREARAAGMNDVLTKPVKLDRMAACLRQWTVPKVPNPPLPKSPGEPKPPGPSAERPPEPVAKPPATPAGEEAFPRIAGIDHQAAAEVFGHNRDLFLHLLARFHQEFAQIVEETRADLAVGKRSAAAIRLHNLRGNAGMLGAHALMRDAQWLEEALDQGMSDIDDRLVQLGHQVLMLQKTSAPWLKSR